MLNLIRSIVFNVLFYLNTVVWLIVALPTFFMPYRAILEVAKAWGRINLVLLRVVAGIELRDPRAGKIAARAAHRRRQASVDLGNLRAAAAVPQPGLHHEARIAVDSDFRLVHRSRAAWCRSTAAPARRRSTG